MKQAVKEYHLTGEGDGRSAWLEPPNVSSHRVDFDELLGALAGGVVGTLSRPLASSNRPCASHLESLEERSARRVLHRLI